MALREVIARLGYEIDRGSEQKVKKSMDGVLGSIKGVAATFGLAFGAAEVVRGFATMISLASDATETANQLGAVFGDAADKVAEGLSDVARETGRSEFQMRAFGARMGALLKPLLGSRDAAAEMSEEVVSLTADMSSFFNITQEEALDKFRAGLIGSSEPLIGLGIDVRDAALAQFALSKGITTATKDMDTATKTALRFELIASKLTEVGAVGDAAKTAREGANAFRAIGQVMTDVGTRMGQFFLPAAVKTANTLSDFARSINASLQPGEKLHRVMQFISSSMDLLARAAFFLAGKIHIVLPLLALMAALIFPVPALLIATAAAALLVAEDLEVMAEGGESAIARLEEAIKSWGKETLGVSDETFNVIWDWLKIIGEATVDAFIAPLSAVPDLLRAMVAPLQAVVELFKGFPDLSTLRTIGAFALPGVVRAPAAPAAGGGGTSITSSPTSTVNVTVQGAADPEATGSAVAQHVRSEMEKQNRAALAAFMPR